MEWGCCGRGVLLRGDGPAMVMAGEVSCGGRRKWQTKRRRVLGVGPDKRPRERCNRRAFTIFLHRLIMVVGLAAACKKIRRNVGREFTFFCLHDLTSVVIGHFLGLVRSAGGEIKTVKRIKMSIYVQWANARVNLEEKKMPLLLLPLFVLMRNGRGLLD